MSNLKFWISELLRASGKEADKLANKIVREFPVSEQEMEAIRSGRTYNLDLSHTKEVS